MSVRELRELHIANQFCSLRSDRMLTAVEDDSMQVDNHSATPQHDTPKEDIQRQVDEIVAHLFEEVISTCSNSHHEAKIEEGDEVGWDGVLASVDARNYPVALWKLVTENIDILW